ncbi:acyl-coenzyme A thioesterase PaaI-like protein [Melghirimyces profundicolus]|uniref:Transcription factor FapR n=1 Tax=Melghirimyces profundicolus TaxID=1242148 RepID=A0A2T6BYV3_9BACL|nr:transcription factor FapR [Melghirimyces profundicolus]PTX61249.1 acyl-coenzyme A thioesterase PaaI-like protein [Melghirimyces profundicolus]
MRLSKRERQKKLKLALEAEPFLTDEEMARRYGVSIQTIRLDRMELGIPELRGRMKHMAERNFDHVRSLYPEEVIGQVTELKLDQSGVSKLEIREEHVFARNRIARGHHLFAQANSLAVAVVDAELVLTATASIRFVRPVRLGEICVAKAHVTHVTPRRTQVDVRTFVEDETVFQGIFDVYRSKEDQ